MQDGIITVGGENNSQNNTNNPLNPQVTGRNPNQNIQEEKLQQLSKEHDIPREFMDTEFLVPTDEVLLPSKGVFYPNGKDRVTIKYLTAEDENILGSQDLIKSGKVLDVLLQNAIIDKSISPEDMLTGDRNAVLIALRTTGYGDEYEVNQICPSCNSSHKAKVLLSELKTKEMSDKPDSDGLFSVQLPKCKANIRFRLLTGADESRLAKIAETGKRTIGKNLKVQTVLTERYVLQIMEVNGNNDKTYIKKFVSVMPIADSMFFREYISEIEPNIDMNYDYECPECGHVYNAPVPVTAKLFWPNANI
jgi:rubredoxin